MNEREITLEALADLPESAYVLYDVRDAVSYAYGTVPGAASLPDPVKAAEDGALPRDKKLVLFCMHGRLGGCVGVVAMEVGATVVIVD